MTTIFLSDGGLDYLVVVVAVGRGCVLGHTPMRRGHSLNSTTVRLNIWGSSEDRSVGEEDKFLGQLYTDKKENRIFLKYKEIQSGSVAKSHMRKGFLIYEEMPKYFPIYEEAVSHLQLLQSEFSYTVYEENLFSFLSVYNDENALFEGRRKGERIR